MEKQNSKKLNKIFYKSKIILIPITYVLVLFLAIFLLFGNKVKLVFNTLDLFFLDKPYNFNKVENVIPNNDLNLNKVVLPSYGDLLGVISTDDGLINNKIYYGDSEVELNKGVGTYAGGYIPGEGRTIIMGGHNNSVFHNLNKIKIGDEIKIRTNYSTYIYKVVDTKITNKADKTAYDLNVKNENLILYTCYSESMYGLTDDRLFVYAQYVSGYQKARE